jgi:hypothetical protein
MTNGELRAVSSGIDSIYVSAKGYLRDGLIKLLDDARLAADGETCALQFDAAERNFLLVPYGWRGYRFWLKSLGYDLMIGTSTHFPPAYVQIRSSFIHSVGVESALVDVVDCLRRFVLAGPFTLGAARVDVYVDLQGWSPCVSDYSRFVKRAQRWEGFPEEQAQPQFYGLGHEFSGFAFGKKPLAARIYNKTLKMAKDGEDWQSLLWMDADPAKPVWRVEFEFWREVLKEMGLLDPDAAIENRQGLWNYGTKDWLSLRKPGIHKRVARWAVDPAWEWLSAVEIGMPSSPLVRVRRRGRDRERLIAGVAGYTSSLAALEDQDELDEVLEELPPAVNGYLATRGRSFRGDVRRKRELLLRPRALPEQSIPGGRDALEC